MALKAIKNKIKSVDRTRKVTKAMEAVSAVKMRGSQQRALSGRAYARAAVSVLSRISGSAVQEKHALTRVRPIEKVLLVVITSDKGLAGSLNAAVLKEAEKVITGLSLSKERISLITLGRKAKEYFARRGYEIVSSYENMSDTISIEDMQQVTDIATERFALGAADYVALIYTNFYSTFEQRATSRPLLPLSIESVAELVKGIVPEKGTFSQMNDLRGHSLPTVYTVEPSEEVLFNELLPRLVGIAVYHALNESKASEHSARMVAMKNASDKSLEMSKDLTREYNRERQAAITSELSEIVGGIEAMAGN